MNLVRSLFSLKHRHGPEQGIESLHPILRIGRQIPLIHSAGKSLTAAKKAKRPIRRNSADKTLCLCVGYSLFLRPYRTSDICVHEELPTCPFGLNEGESVRIYSFEFPVWLAQAWVDPLGNCTVPPVPGS